MAIAATTPVPTPSGWVLACDIKPADYVFDASGRPQSVGSVQSFIPRRCYRVTFDDGLWLEGDGRLSFALQDKVWRHHQTLWFNNQTRKHAKKRFRRPLKVMSLGDLYGTDLEDARKRKKWSLQATQPLQYPAVDLPVPPYVLGLWLGTLAPSGRHYQNGIDLDRVQRAVRQFGFQIRTTNYHGKREMHFRPSVRESFTYARAEIPHHIPTYYLESDVESREMLLRGLIDAEKIKQTRPNPNTMRVFDSWASIRRTQQLLEGLGHKTTLEKEKKETSYRLTYTKKPKNLALIRRYITKIEKIEPTQCVHLAVDENFVAGEGFLAAC